MDIALRRAADADFTEIDTLTDLAFRPEDVVTFLHALRAEGCVMGEWVTEAAGEILAHIAFSRAYVETPDGARLAAAFLSPLSVRPGHQRMGLGQQLMARALAELRAEGETLFLVVGHPTYYPRAGFAAVDSAQLDNPWPGNPAFMSLGPLPDHGTLVLPKAIAEVH
ncbi:MAG: N-acetyltransferase [Ancalomicrobiaceae bacterium]|nr:N-acetyltransferase [Ancalomicrobiaceae bacterium]